MALSIVVANLAMPVTASQTPVEYHVEAFIVDNGKLPATRADYGDIVEYQLTVTNTGATTLPPGTVTVTGPTPDGTILLERTATPSSAEILTEYSADGEVFYEAETEAVAQGPLTAVRWTLLTGFEPGENRTLTYRVEVEESDVAETPPPVDLRSLERFAASMFGHLGIIQFSCPEPMFELGEDAICGMYDRAFTRFRESWDLYADWEDRVPFVPEPITAWNYVENGTYIRAYSYEQLRFAVVYVEFEGSPIIVVVPR